MDPLLGKIDWQAPWLAPWRGDGERLSRQILAGQACSEVLSASGAPVRFVAQDALPAGTAYETFIFETGQVPTRDGLHDFFNGLVWLHFPSAKRRLNALQAAQIATRGVQAERGPVRDAITVLDENGVLFQGPDALWEALSARDWMRLFVDLRRLWEQARVTLFGHALMEKLVSPRKAITGHVLRVPCTVAAVDVDGWLAQQLGEDLLARKPFTPMPVLGVPGWWAANETSDFYVDAAVFRAAR